MTIPSKLVEKMKINKVTIEFEDEEGKHIREFPRDFKGKVGKTEVNIVYIVGIDEEAGITRYYGPLSQPIVNEIKKDLDKWLFDASIGFTT